MRSSGSAQGGFVKVLEDLVQHVVEAFAGGDIQTNPSTTNEVVEKSSKIFSRQIDRLPDPEVVGEIDRTVDMGALERRLMAEGLKKFIEPQRMILKLIAQRRTQLFHASR